MKNWRKPGEWRGEWRGLDECESDPVDCGETQVLHSRKSRQICTDYIRKRTRFVSRQIPPESGSDGILILALAAWGRRPVAAARAQGVCVLAFAVC